MKHDDRPSAGGNFDAACLSVTGAKRDSVPAGRTPAANASDRAFGQNECVMPCSRRTDAIVASLPRWQARERNTRSNYFGVAPPGAVPLLLGVELVDDGDPLPRIVLLECDAPEYVDHALLNSSWDSRPS
jgi:hypothetical protein